MAKPFVNMKVSQSKYTLPGKTPKKKSHGERYNGVADRQGRLVTWKVMPGNRNEGEAFQKLIGRVSDWTSQVADLGWSLKTELILSNEEEDNENNTI